MYSPGEKFSDAVDHLIDADQALYGGTHIAAICNEMVDERGIPGTDCPS